MQINSLKFIILSVIVINETLQSKIDYNQTRLQRATKAPWPKFELDGDLLGSEQFVLHRPTSIGPSTSKPPAIINSVATEQTQKYVRYSLPFQTSDKLNVTSNDSSRIILENYQPRVFQAKDLVAVSMPKIYVNMAFTGHYDKISVPRKRISKSKKSAKDVELFLPRSSLMRRSQPRMDDGLQPPPQDRIVTFPKDVIVNGVKSYQKQYLADRNDIPWTSRMVRSLQNWASGFFNIFRRRSFTFGRNQLETLYRPEKWQMDDPYIVNRKSEVYGEPIVGGSEPRVAIVTSTNLGKTFDNSAWRPVTTKAVLERFKEPEDEIIDETNYWRKLPKFSTSSNRKQKSFYWRSFPVLSNRRSGVSTGYWVPGRPGPLVWGDLAGKLEEEQDKYLKMFPTKLNVTSRER